MTWWAAGNARQPMGPQSREAQRPDHRVLGTSRAGVGPAPSAGIVFATAVIVRGPTGAPVGVFVYAAGTTPKLGNPPIASTTNQAKDPFGNVVVPGGTAYITVASGTGVGRYAITLGDQANPYTQFAALTFQNLTHPANLPPGVVGQVDTVQGAQLELQSGKLTAGAKGSIISMTDNTATNTSVSVVADAVTISPAALTTTGFQLTGFITLGNQASTPAAIVGGAVLEADSNGFLRFLPDLNSGDTVIYEIGHVDKFSTTDQSVTSTTFATVCGSATVGTGTYRVRAVLQVTQGAVSDVNKFRVAFTGTISQVRMDATFVGFGGVANSVFAVQTTSLNGALNPPAFVANANYRAEFNGIIVTTSSGTLSVQAAETTAGDSFTVLALSFFREEPAN